MSEPVALVVEDDAVVAAMLRDWLGGAGWDVRAAPSAEEALALADLGRPDLVLLDLVLPGGFDGATLAAHLRLRAGWDRVPMVVMSSRTDAGPAGLAAGAQAFLPKPFNAAELFAAVEAVRAPPPVHVGVALTSPATVPGPVSAPVLASGLLAGLAELHEALFTGVIDVAPQDGAGARISLRRGNPVAVRMADATTTFGRILVELRLVEEDALSDCLEHGQRTGLPLGEILLRARLVDRRTVEWALREQVVRRIVALAARPDVVWAATAGDALGLAGFEVELAVVQWRAGDSSREVPVEPTGYVHLAGWIRPWWRLFDPDDSLADARSLLFSGAPVAQAIAVGGSPFARFLRHLAGHRLVEFRDTPPPRPAVPIVEPAAFAAGVLARQRLWADASHYTVLGLGDDADSEAIDVAVTVALAGWHPDEVPSALDSGTRKRARALYDRILEAGRVLGDPARRTVYDAQLAGSAQVRSGTVPSEQDPTLLAERARMLLRRGEAVVAAGLLSRAVALLPEDAGVLALLGRARRAACVEDEAAGEIEVRRAAAMDPADTSVLCYLGDLVRGRGAIGEAVALYRAALRRDPGFEPAREGLRALELG